MSEMLNQILDLIIEYRYVIFAGASIGIYGAFKWTWQDIKDKVHILIIQAKRMAKDKVLNSGQEQEDWVVKQLLDILPTRTYLMIKILVMITGGGAMETKEDEVRHLVKWVYEKAKDLLDDGKINGSVK